jgi:1-acyl-sn-glycerol-3-phosphate acyltransferase
VLKRELLLDPCLDIVGHRLPNAFVRRDGVDGDVDAVVDLTRDLGERDGVLNYPEGTRFSPEKQRRVVERLSEKGRIELALRAERMRHVLLPRPGGPLALLAAAPDADVVLCMHHGFEAAASAADLWSGRLIGRRIQVRCVRYPSDEFPSDPEDWLLDRWDEVDAYVERCERGGAQGARDGLPVTPGAPG